jgi:hypothetical protein
VLRPVELLLLPLLLLLLQIMRLSAGKHLCPLGEPST